MKSLARFLTAATSPAHFPVAGPPEFAFLGRSNVGKSSLINSLLQQDIAHVSSSPGRTRSINFIGIYEKPTHLDPELMLVDLPGYGYAKISREISAEWPKFIEPYLKKRKTLALCFLLIDANVPAQKSDHQLIEFLRSVGREFIVVATKTDKLSGNKLRDAIDKLTEKHGLESLLLYSAKTAVGRSELWQEIRKRATLTTDNTG